MHINHSRIRATSCWRKCYNVYHRGVAGDRSMNLADGGALHVGIAHGMATKDWQSAEELAIAELDKSMEEQQLLPEQSYLKDEHRTLVREMLKMYKTNYGEEQYVIIQPECEFNVALPGSMHNCIFLHWHHPVLGDQWGNPPHEVITAGDCHPAHKDPDPTCACWQPHRLVGKTDSVVAWQNVIWILEHKTSSISGEMWKFQWQLDLQPSLYIWAIGQTLGITPRGFILNTINKPSEAQIASWNSRRKHGPPKSIVDYLGFDREIFLREPADLDRAVSIAKETASEWERRVSSSGHLDEAFPLRPVSGNCLSYNRVCDSHPLCVDHDRSLDAYAGPVRVDYVVEAQENLLVQITGAVR